MHLRRYAVKKFPGEHAPGPPQQECVYTKVVQARPWILAHSDYQLTIPRNKLQTWPQIKRLNDNAVIKIATKFYEGE